MGIIRVEKQKNFSIIANIFLNDPRLSLKAKGFLTILLSKPDDWKVKVSFLVKCSNDGKDAHYSALHELIKFGYIVKRKRRNDKGQIRGVEYIVHEESISNSEKPVPENPEMVNPDLDNSELLNTDRHKTDFKKRLTTTSERELSSFFDTINLKFDTHKIRSIIQSFFSIKAESEVRRAIEYANAKTYAKDAITFQAYLTRILKEGCFKEVTESSNNEFASQKHDDGLAMLKSLPNQALKDLEQSGNLIATKILKQRAAAGNPSTKSNF